jgi:hypothetical protein
MKQSGKIDFKFQQGYVLVIVLILMLVGSLIISSVLKYMGTGIITTKLYNDKSQQLYAAGSGIEDGRWIIKKGHLTSVFPGPNPPAYNPYDYYDLTGNEWTYSLNDQTGVIVNNLEVDVSIRNMWMPDFTAPSATTAQNIIEGSVGNPPKVIMTGSIDTLPHTDTSTGVYTPGTYNIKIVYSGSDPLIVQTIGIWLPPGFSYHAANNNNLNNTISGSKMYSSEVGPEIYKSGQKILWTFASYPFSGDGLHSVFPGVRLADAPDLASTIQFQFDGPEATTPAAVSWITHQDLGGGLTYTWDADQKVFQIVSSAGDTTVDSYTIKSELRQMAASIQGDYYATGNSLMTNSRSDNYHIRDTWTSTDHASSNVVAAESAPGAGNGVPSDGEVQAAYLYWTSWFHESQKTTVSPLNPDNCSTFNNWGRSGTPYLSTAWGGDGDVFLGHNQNNFGDNYRYLTLNNGVVDLSDYAEGLVIVSWDQGVELSSVGLTDDCRNFNNWSQAPLPNTWNVSHPDYSSYYYTGHYDAGESRDLSLNSDFNLSGFSAGQVTISWKQWETISTTSQNIFADTCEDLNDWPGYGGAWSVRNYYGSYYFRGTSTSLDSSTTRDIIHLEPLQGYTSGGTVTLRWDQREGGYLESTDGLDVQISTDGVSWTTVYSPRDDIGSTWQPQSVTIPSQFLTSGFRVKFHLLGCGTDEYWELDNIHITYTPTGPGPNDGLDVYFSNDSGMTWSDPVVVFRGVIRTDRPSANNANIDIPVTYLDENFIVRYSLVGFGSSGHNLNLDDISIVTSPPPPVGENDGLDFRISGDNGDHYSAAIQAFRGNIASQSYSYAIPRAYLTDEFKIRFELVGFSQNGQYCTIDNIKLTVGMPDSTVFFKIDGTQVYFDNSGNPQQGIQNITADKTAVINNVIGTDPNGFSYACFKDVTALVRSFSDSPTDPPTNRPGIATYTVGDVDGTLGNDGRPGDGYQLSHAGWSLIIIYANADTLGHQLYLFDRFSFCDDFSDLDFNQDDIPGGDIRGFLVPERVGTETNAAKMTVMVGEGDDFIAGSSGYPGDFVAFNAPSNYWVTSSYAARNIPNSYKLWDGKLSQAVNGSNTSASPNNVWNGLSTAFNADGIDVDTFYVPWSSGLLSAGDTSAHIDLCTAQDNWNLIYIILSFRSSVTTGGAVSYLIH